MVSALHRLIGMGALGAGLLLAGSITNAAESTRGPAVVELFTSEGCSSCPPAEAVLTALAARDDVLTLGFHVTYWDGLGWRDRFGLAEAVARQRRYVTALGLATSYTPQVIVNGRVDVLGSDRASIQRLVQGLQRPASIGVSRTPEKATLDLPSMPTGECPCELLLLGVRPQAETVVGGGENRGRTLRATNIVRSITRAGSWIGDAELRKVAMPPLSPDTGLLVVLAQGSRDSVVKAAGRLAIQSHSSPGSID